MCIPGISKTLAENIIQIRDTSKDFDTLDDVFTHQMVFVSRLVVSFLKGQYFQGY
jgi:hypothetical protein